jgi:hypothetical protein
MRAEDRRRMGGFVANVAAGTLATTALLSSKAIAAALVVSIGGAATWVAVTAEPSPAAREEQPADGPGRSASSPGLLVDPETERETPAPESEPPAGGPVGTPAVGPAVGMDGTPAAGPDGTQLEGEQVRRSRSDRPRPRSRAAAPPRGPTVEQIAVEAEMLEHARSYLAADPAAALRDAEAHRSRYPSGQLAPERELIAVDALMRLGRRVDAEARAAAFVARSPNGLYARRAHRLVAP